MKVTINGMIFEGSEDEIRRIVENPPRMPSESFATAGCGRCTFISESKTTPDSACMEGKTTKDGCKHYLNGYCTATVCTSCPPKYQACSFEMDIPIYKFCSEVDGTTPYPKPI